LLKLGEIPDVLSTLVVKLLYGQISEAEYRDFFTETEKRERALEMAESLRIVCTAALLEPRIVENPEADDEISIDDLEDSEQRIIFDLAMLEASALTRFRERQEELVGAMDGLEDDEFQTEPVGVSQG
jgi:hypothetical protein